VDGLTSGERTNGLIKSAGNPFRPRAGFAFDLERERQAATRMLEHEKAGFARELELLRAELQAAHDHSRRVTDARFALYSDVWARLQHLRETGDDLWHDATRVTAERFGIAFLEARSETSRGRLILREDDYQELQRVLETFTQYDIGLTTWSRGRRISGRDIQMARYFDRADDSFSGADIALKR
jgi:hypothetical protein